MKNLCIVSSVGTSLLDNNKEERYTDFFDDLKKIKGEKIGIDFNEENFMEEYDKVIRNHYDLYEKFEADSEFSAEINSIEKILKRFNPEKVKIFLLPSFTGASFFCAEKVKEYFNSEYNVKISIIENLGSPEDPKFEEKGLPSLLEKLVDIINEHENTFEVVLNPTGGYKSLFPILTIVGMLYGKSVFYVYEESENLITIPALPVGMDIFRWNSISNIIDVFVRSNKKDVNLFKPLFRNLSINSLLVESKNEIHKSKIFEFFDERKEELEKRFNPLFAKTKEYSLKLLLKDDDLKTKFDTLSKLSYLIWKGDKVPEMVDHAERHHTNLFNIAERILVPLFLRDENFLSSEELFILLGVIFLHDCGHVISAVKYNGEIVKLYPNEIRNYHHILGYLRLKNFDEEIYLSRVFYEELEKEWKISSKEIWENYLSAPAIIGLYHRKKMPMIHGEFNDCFFMKNIKPLNSQDIYFKGKPISKEKVLLICSLFRVIDSLDQQVKRSGDEQEINFHISQLETESKLLKDKAEKIKQAIVPEIISEENFKEVEKFIEKSIIQYRGRESKSKENNSENQNFHFRNELENLKTKFKNEKFYLIEDYIETRLWADFKDFQKEHFDGHKSINRVLIDFKIEENEKIDFYVNLDSKKDVSKIYEDMEKEYKNEEVLKVLNKHNIIFNYGKNKEEIQ